MRTEFDEITKDTSVTEALMRLQHDNSRSMFSDPIKYWIMTGEVLSKLRMEAMDHDYVAVTDGMTWQFMGIQIATVAQSGTGTKPFVEAVY